MAKAKRKIISVTPQTWEDALEDFMHLKQAQGRSKTTIDDYNRHINYFFKRFPNVFQDPKKLKTAIYEYMSDNIKPNTFNLRREYLNAFFNWCVKESIIKNNPFDDIPKKKDSFKEVNIQKEILTNLLALPYKTTLAGLRDYSLLLLTLDTGIRPSEAFGILVSDLNLKGYEIYIRADIAKTRVDRTLPIMYITADSIKQLLRVRHEYWGDNVPVFCTYQGTKLNRKTWQKDLNYTV